MRGLLEEPDDQSAVIGGLVIGGTTGSVLFINPSNTLAQDNANFFWDDTNNRLGIGTNSPAGKLHIVSSADDFPGSYSNNMKVDAASYPTIWFNRTSDSTGFLYGVDNRGLNLSSVAAGVATSRMVISYAGLVGIGTTLPIDKLDVTGTGKAVLTSSGGLNIYGSLYTDASNYARGVFQLNGNEFQIITEKAGSPTMRDISITPGTGRALYFGSNGVSYKWYITSTGDLLTTDNTYDIGASGATRPRTIYLANQLNVTNDGLAATQVTGKGIVLQNTTASTSGVPVQLSPSIRFSGTGWKTDATTASQVVDGRIYYKPVSQAGGVAGRLIFEGARNGGGYSHFLEVYDSGRIEIYGGISINGDVGTSGYVMKSSGGGLNTWGTLAFSDLSSHPTTISGYGITNAMAAGTYSPGFHILSNITSFTVTPDASYADGGNQMVIVSGAIEMDITSADTFTEFGIDVPTTPNFSNWYEAYGHITFDTPDQKINAVGLIVADTGTYVSNNSVYISFMSRYSGTVRATYTFSYRRGS